MIADFVALNDVACHLTPLLEKATQNCCGVFYAAGAAVAILKFGSTTRASAIGYYCISCCCFSCYCGCFVGRFDFAWVVKGKLDCGIANGARQVAVVMTKAELNFRYFAQVRKCCHLKDGVVPWAGSCSKGDRCGRRKKAQIRNGTGSGQPNYYYYLHLHRYC